MSDSDRQKKLDEEGYWLSGRLPSRTYFSSTFEHQRPNSSYNGEPARFVYKVFDVAHQTDLEDAEAVSWTIRKSPKGRVQVKLLVVREVGHVKHLMVHRQVRRAKGPPSSEVLLDLEGVDARRLVELIRNLDMVSLDADSESLRVDDSILRDLLEDPTGLDRAYQRNPEGFRRLISDDRAGQDVVAVAARRAALDRFERMLTDQSFFDELAEQHARPEDVWQRFFEANPWIFGCSLAGQFLTTWSQEALEQVVSGSQIGSTMKRVDALMRTAGRVRSMVFAEIKTHRTPLLQTTERPYRSGCWAPSPDLSGGVAQVQGSVQRAIEQLGYRIQSTDEEGYEIPGDLTYLFQPRSFLVVGSLDELARGDGADNVDRIRSFEVYRRNLVSPEILTFDELYERTRWLVDMTTAST